MTPELPSRKVGAGALAGALSVIVVWCAGAAGLDVPPEVASAATTVIGFAVGYYVSD